MLTFICYKLPIIKQVHNQFMDGFHVSRASLALVYPIATVFEINQSHMMIDHYLHKNLMQLRCMQDAHNLLTFDHLTFDSIEETKYDFDIQNII